MRGTLKRLNAKHLTYPGLLHDVEFCAYDGEISMILGDSYSCRRALLRTLAGLSTGYGGIVSYYDARGENTVLEPDKTAFCPGGTALSGRLSVREHIILGCCMSGMNKKAACLQADRFLDRFGFAANADDRVDSLSEGDRLTVSVLTALAPRPEWAFLEDISLGMKDEKTLMLWDYLKEIKDRTVLVITTRYIQEAEYLADRIFFAVRQGIQVSGTIAEIMRSTGRKDLLSAYMTAQSRESGADE